MRVLHLDTGREMRGGQWQALHLCEGLAARGHEVILLAREPLRRAAAARGVEARPWAALGWPPADIVHAHDARSHTVAAAAARSPLVVSRRVAFPVRTGPLSAWKYRRAAHYIAVSEFVRRRLLEAGVPPERVSVVYDGVPAAPAARGGSKIVALATSDPLKGTALLAEAAAAGGFEVHYSAYLQADLDDAAVFVYITHEEGLGSAALVAMAGGIPVVASRVGGLPEAVADGETGILVDNEVAAITEAVRRAAGNREMGRRGRERASALFSLDRMIQATVAVYDQVLGC